MADMKQIFTYPNNSGSDFIDPNYIGDANSGLTKRVDELLDETYKSWSNLDPVSDLGTTTSEAMQNLSKYINYYGDNQFIQNLTFNDFWYQPLVVMNKTLIAQPATIQLGDTNNPATITTTADHDFQDNQVVRLTGLNGSWQTVIGTSTDYYAKRISSTQLQISKNSQLTDLVGFISTQTIDVQSDLRETNQIVQFVFPTNYAYPDGMAVDVNTVQFNGQTMVGNTYYTKASTSGVNVYDMYEDSGLTNPLMVSEIIPFTQEQFSGVLNVDNAVLTIDTSGDPITTNETKGFATSVLRFAGTNDAIPSGTNNMLHLQSTGTSQLWEVYDDPDFLNPEGGVVNRNREYSVISNTAGSQLYNDTAPIQFYNQYDWVKNDVNGLVAQPHPTPGNNYNFSQLEGTQLWRGPAIGPSPHQDDVANLYTDAALTQPLTRNSLNGDLFTYANNGLTSFPFETDTLTLTEDGTVPGSPTNAMSTDVWFTKTGIQDYVASSTRIYQDPTTHILYTDNAHTQPIEATAFTTPVDANDIGVDWMPNGSPFDTAVIKIPNRTQVLERIQIQEHQNQLPPSLSNGNLLNALIGTDIYLTHLGSQEYEMYLDAAKTQPVHFDLYKSLGAVSNPTINVTGGAMPNGVYDSQIDLGQSMNYIQSPVALNKNQLAFWLENDVTASLGMGVTLFPGGQYYYLSIAGSPPSTDFYMYEVYTNPARTVRFQSPLFSTPITVSNIMDQNGINLPYNGEQLATKGLVGAKYIDYNIGTVTGNGQNFSNDIFYPDSTYSNQLNGYGLFTDVNRSNPLTVAEIDNNSAGLTRTYQFSPVGGNDGIAYRDSNDQRQYRHFNETLDIDGDTNPSHIYSKFTDLGSRKFIHNDTDRVDTDNKLLTQAGLLTVGNEYYIDFVNKQAGVDAWGLFTSFNNSNATPLYPTEYEAKRFTDPAETPWTTVDKFPDDLLVGDASLDYQLYSHFPLDDNGDNILTTHGALQDDGQTVTLNDPVNHASTFGWFTITSHNNFADTIATNETLRLSPTEKCRYTGYTLNGDRLFELVDNNDTKIPVNMSNYTNTTVTVKNTDFLPAVQTYGSPSSGAADYVVGDHYSLHAIADSVTLDRRKPYVFWDASNNFYVGMWTGQKYTKQIPSQPNEVYKNMMFWTKAGWANSERHLVNTAVPTTLYTAFFALAPTSTRTSSATFDYEDAFAFNNIAGEYSTTQTTPNGIPLDRNNGWLLVQDYSVEGTEPTTEPGQPGQGNPGGNLGAAFTNADNTGYDQWMLSHDIVVPALQRHTMGTATSMLYVEEVVWGSPTFRSDGRQQVVAYNPTYNNTDTTPNPYYNYFNHGDIIDLPGIDGTGTASYVLLKRGDNTKLKYKYTTTSTPDPTGSSTDIVTEDMEGEVWGVIPLANWTGPADQGYSGGTWTNNSLWIADAAQLYTDPAGGTNFIENSLNLFQQGPISTLPMFSKFQPTHTYPNTYAVSTGAAYTGSVTVRAGNVANGTPFTSSQFQFIAGKQHQQLPLNHTNKYKVTEETPWDLGTVPINTRPISNQKMDGGANIGGFGPISDSARMKRYISSTETHDLFGYEGRISFDGPCKLTSTAIDIRPAYTGDVNITFGITPVNTTQGTISLSPNQPQPYKADSVEIILPGNTTYSYQDTNNNTVYAGNVEANKWYEPGTNEITKASAETDATFTVGVNGSGKLNSIALATEGRFDNGNQQLRQLESPANQYVPPTPTPAELADVWDTDDEWTTDGFNTNKEWPKHVTPQSANVVYNSPTIVNTSSSGIKYTRSMGHTKWQLEVTYPPMNASDFQKFHAIAQAAHGQSTPFYFVLRNKDNDNILWKSFDRAITTTLSPLLKDAINPGDTTMLVEGFASNENDVFKRGEVFIDGENENGALHTSLSQTDSNIFGEAKIRLPWPFRKYNGPGNKIYKDPYHAIVTLADDNFNYSVDQNGYYYVTVMFDLDGWK